MPLQKAITWLKTASLILIGFGLLSLSGTVPSLSAVSRLFLDLAFWPVDGQPVSNGADARLFWAISGGILCGWGIMIWLIADRVFARDPDLARTMVITSILTWFVVDSAGSVIAGAPMNAVFNLGFLALFLIPVIRPIQQTQPA